MNKVQVLLYCGTARHSRLKRPACAPHPHWLVGTLVSVASRLACSVFFSFAPHNTLYPDFISFLKPSIRVLRLLTKPPPTPPRRSTYAFGLGSSFSGLTLSSAAHRNKCYCEQRASLARKSIARVSRAESTVADHVCGLRTEPSCWAIG